MAIQYHPPKGTILICDFDHTFKQPEMVKRRPVIVMSPPIKGRSGLCTVVCCSTTEPNPVMPYHLEIELKSALPTPWSCPSFWIKGDMIYSVGFHRLNLIRLTKNHLGERQYYKSPLNTEQLNAIYACVLHGLGLFILDETSLIH